MLAVCMLPEGLMFVAATEHSAGSVQVRSRPWLGPISRRAINNSLVCGLSHRSLGRAARKILAPLCSTKVSSLAAAMSGDPLSSHRSEKLANWRQSTQSNTFPALDAVSVNQRIASSFQAMAIRLKRATASSSHELKSPVLTFVLAEARSWSGSIASFAMRVFLS